MPIACAAADELDAIGNAAHLDAFVEQLSGALGAPLPAVGRHNRSERVQSPSDALLEQITADKQLDLELIAHINR